MKIEVASQAGFCFGVNRAVEMVYSLIGKGKKVYTLGPIIHNSDMIAKMENDGVIIINKLDEVDNDGVLVIRSHGVSRSIIETLDKLNLDYIDATCPFVKRIHDIVSKNSADNVVTLIAGDKTHPEVKGIMSYCKGKVYTFNYLDELLDIISNNELFNSKIIVVAQTTFNLIEWNSCVNLIRKVCHRVLVFDTICSTTEKRQSEAENLSKKVDLMIVVGGKHSSNTTKLYNICKKNCKTYFIENSNDISMNKLRGSTYIGITAGASTPAIIIEEVKQKMEEIMKKNEGQESQMDFEQMLEESLKNLSTDNKVKGVVVGITPSEVYVDIGRKHAGFIPLSELSSDPNAKSEDIVKVGDELELLIMKTNDQDGTIMLSKRRVDAENGWNKITKAMESKEVLSGRVIEIVKGGIIVNSLGMRIFIPASLATLSRKDSLDDLKNKDVQFRIIEVDKGRKKAVGSIRSVLNEKKKELLDKFWSDIEVGQTRQGKVKSFTSYGAFVDLGAIDGMIHISDLSWDRIKHPSDVLKIGQVISVYIKDFNKEEGKVSLGYRLQEDNPWEKLKNNYSIGSIIEVEIVGLTRFGAFAKILPGIDGLIHISQISNSRVEKPEDVLSIGQKVNAKITDIDFENHKVSLSIKDALTEENKSLEE